jgi:transcription elongation factor
VDLLEEYRADIGMFRSHTCRLCGPFRRIQSRYRHAPFHTVYKCENGTCLYLLCILLKGPHSLQVRERNMPISALYSSERSTQSTSVRTEHAYICSTDCVDLLEEYRADIGMFRSHTSRLCGPFRRIQSRYRHVPFSHL